MERDQKHYLIVKPPSHLRAEVEPRIDELYRITGIGKATILQRFTGSALQVLKVSNASSTSSASKAELNEIASKLIDVGILSTVISKNDIDAFNRGYQIKSIELAKNHVKLFTAEGDDKEFSIDKDTKCIIVVSTPSHHRIQSKRLARTALNDGAPLPAYEILSTIFRNSPVMSIFIEGVPAQLRIDSRRFNHNSLGDENRQSAALNFPFMIKEIQRVAECVTIETGYGENNLPFLNINDKDFYREFSKYSAFIALAYADGIFTIPSPYGGLLEIPVIKELGSIMWGGPFINVGGKGDTSKKIEEATIAPKRSLLKPPPEAPVKVNFRHNPLKLFTKFSATHAGIKLRTLGPSLIIYPLSLLTILPVMLSSIIDSIVFVPIAVAPLGLILFTHSFTLIGRKRAIENCPTSRVKTMPMGEVEVTGRARARYCLRAPFSMTECAYYSYKLYERVHTRNGPKEVLREWGHSGNIPFYLEDLHDKDERAIILSKDAIIKAGRSETFRGDALSAILTGLSNTTSNRRVVETTIPIGSKLYIMGFAHRLITTRREKRAGFTEKLKALKNNRALLLKKYDTDHDGKIDEEEWSRAVKDLEDEALVERLNRKKKDDIAIGAHPTGGLFYISDRAEESIIGSMKWRIPLFLILGIAGTSLGGLYILKLFGNKDILDKLSAFIN